MQLIVNQRQVECCLDGAWTNVVKFLRSLNPTWWEGT